MKRILFFVLMQLFSAFAFAQIQGDIVDQNNKGLPNAIIIATDSLRNVMDTVKSDHRGFYSFRGLTPGNYKIQVKATGFKSFILQNVEVKNEDIGAVKGDDFYQGQRLDITLTPAKTK